MFFDETFFEVLLQIVFNGTYIVCFGHILFFLNSLVYSILYHLDGLVCFLLLLKMLIKLISMRLIHMCKRYHLIGLRYLIFNVLLLDIHSNFCADKVQGNLTRFRIACIQILLGTKIFVCIWVFLLSVFACSQIFRVSVNILKLFVEFRLHFFLVRLCAFCHSEKFSRFVLWRQFLVIFILLSLDWDPRWCHCFFAAAISCLSNLNDNNHRLNSLLLEAADYIFRRCHKYTLWADYHFLLVHVSQIFLLNKIHFWIVKSVSRLHLVIILDWLIVDLPSLMILLKVISPLLWHTNLRFLRVAGRAKSIG